MNMVKKFGNGLVNKLNKMNIKDVTDKFERNPDLTETKPFKISWANSSLPLLIPVLNI